MAHDGVWLPLSLPPEKDGCYIAYGPKVSGNAFGVLGMWEWRGGIWWCEDGTEVADLEQCTVGWWTAVPTLPEVWRDGKRVRF